MANRNDPAWFKSENFDITATFPPETPKEQVPAMLKALLTDRFHLAAHTEMRAHEVYPGNLTKIRQKAV